MSLHFLHLKLALSIALLTISISAFASDRIIMRNGEEREVSIIRMNNSEVVFYEPHNKKSLEISEQLEDIYMLYFDKRGNVYITPEGKRKTGENQKIPKGADIIYLVSGAEIPAYNIKIDAHTLSYTTSAKIKEGELPHNIPLANVFLIKYHDRVVDIINSLSNDRKSEGLVIETSETETPAAAEKQVTFHSVKKNETLGDIAALHGVTVEEIKEWNDLPGKYLPGSKLSVGTQLMILK